MNLDGAAGIQYRIGKSQLNSKLYRIKQEEKAEMRMHNTLKQRFVAKYSKPSIDQTLDAAFVKMYETHTPGFCYRRNGECRIPQVQSISSSIDFENIHNLLFTDGQVDIEKVLCLHLLSAHKTETLKPPTKNDKALSFLAREQSPLERLIERSKKKYQDESLTKLLPRYILDVKSGNKIDGSDIVIRDGRLAERVIINDKINQLVHTVMSALQNTNPDKMNKLLEISNDPLKLAQIFDKPHIQKFINTLNGQILLYSCDSFHLTQPFKAVTIPLHLETKSKGLTHLVSHIRRNVLQMPTQSTWKAMYNTQIDDKDVPKISSHEEPQNEKKVTGNTTKLKTPENSKRRKKNDSASSRPEKRNNSPAMNEPSSSRKNTENDVQDTTHRLPKYMHFMKEIPTKKASKESMNSEKILKYVDQQSRSPNDSDSEISAATYYPGTEESGVNNIFTNVDITTVATVLREKAEAAIKKDMEELETRSIHESEVPKSPPKPNLKPAKVSIKQMNCIACLQRWKNPLPNPKVPKLKKVLMPVLDEANCSDFRSNSAHRLSIMIDREMKKLDSEGRKQASIEKQKALVQPYKGSKKKRYPTMPFMDGVEIDILDLAKISQEIKEKETKKKLKEFLNTKV